MVHKIVEVHTWECSIPNCPESITAYGEDYALDNGWANENIMDHRMDLCPDHNRQLREFLFDEKIPKDS